MILILNTSTLQKLNCDFIDYSILKMIYSSETKKQACFIGQVKMSEYLGITRQTLNKRLKKLEEKKYIYKSFQYKRVSPKIAKILQYENYEFALLKAKAKKNKETKRKTNTGILELFNKVYERTKRNEKEN